MTNMSTFMVSSFKLFRLPAENYPVQERFFPAHQTALFYIIGPHSFKQEESLDLRLHKRPTLKKPKILYRPVQQLLRKQFYSIP